MVHSVLVVQSIYSGENSEYYIDCKNKAFNSPEVIRYSKLTLSDSSYKKIYTNDGLTIFLRKNKEITEYVVYGNYSERDVKGRKIAFRYYCKSQDNLTNVISKLKVFSHQNNYTLEYQQDIIECVNKNSNHNSLPFVNYLLFAGALGFTTGLYLFFKKNKKKIFRLAILLILILFIIIAYEKNN